jgi:hypothetical protein
MATIPYADENDWADKKGYDSWDLYVADSNPEPNLTKLISFLKQGTRILNNRKHLAAGVTNVTNTDYLDDIKDYNIVMANRMMDVDRNRNVQGAFFRFSPQDFLYSYERDDIQQIALEIGNKVVGGVG